MRISNTDEDPKNQKLQDTFGSCIPTHTVLYTVHRSDRCASKSTVMIVLILPFPFSVTFVLRSKGLKVHIRAFMLGAPCNGSRSKVLTWRVGIKKGITGFFSVVEQLTSFVRG